MKILFVVPYVPSKIYVRPYQLIRGLVAQGHQVTLATLWTSQADIEALDELTAEGVEVYSCAQPKMRSLMNAAAALPGRTPLQAVYSWQPALAKIIAGLLLERKGKDAFDVVHVEHLRGAKYGLYVQELRNQPVYAHIKSLPVIWDSVDSITHLFQQAARQSRKFTSRMITRLELPRTASYEQQLALSFERVLVTSPIDREAFSNLYQDRCPDLPIKLLPNGVDLKYFRPGLEDQKESDTLVISGKMSYHANVTMVAYLFNKIMPLVWQKNPGVKVWIVGKDPGKNIQQLSKHAGVEVTGTVPDIRPYLQRAAAAVSPIQYGAGIQNKVLEAMACGTAVVCTPLAVSALQAVPGTDLLVADQPESFAESILNLLKNPPLRQQLAASGRAYVEKYHDWNQIAGKLLSIYMEAIQSKAYIDA
ncbi:MAG: glycosyltransferase [Anaerolineales bacterium]